MPGRGWGGTFSLAARVSGRMTAEKATLTAATRANTMRVDESRSHHSCMVLALTAALCSAATAKPFERLDGCKFIANRWNDGRLIPRHARRPGDVRTAINGRGRKTAERQRE